jgi:hypothetical protein
VWPECGVDMRICVMRGVVAASCFYCAPASFCFRLHIRTQRKSPPSAAVSVLGQSRASRAECVRSESSVCCVHIPIHLQPTTYTYTYNVHLIAYYIAIVFNNLLVKKNGMVGRCNGDVYLYLFCKGEDTS